MNEAVTRRRQRGVLARLGSAIEALSSRSPAAPALPPHPAPGSHRHQDALAVLTAARAVVGHGWTQHTWYVMETPAGRRRTMSSIFPSRLDRTRVVEACLVGAVMHAAWQQSPRPEHAYPAVDALWCTLLGGTPEADPVGPLSAPPVRVARVRDLTTWNDRPYRTRAEVLDLLDRTTARIADADRRLTPR
ncbi:hypothetical protein AB0C29_05560 [Actinoplanes sp. NPDC048791]|uniref:DUF6197 family protein n=1 Tax=Actinoplanes sp. NPDC048791 TaxID=3154623 RepID=UPI00340CC1C2